MSVLCSPETSCYWQELQSVCKSRPTSTHMHTLNSLSMSACLFCSVAFSLMHARTHTHRSTCIRDIWWGTTTYCTVQWKGVDEQRCASNRGVSDVTPQGALAYADRRHLQWWSVSLSVERQNMHTHTWAIRVLGIPGTAASVSVSLLELQSC